MRLLFRTRIHHWTMTGLLGKWGTWFFGFSRANPTIYATAEPQGDGNE